MDKILLGAAILEPGTWTKAEALILAARRVTAVSTCRVTEEDVIYSRGRQSKSEEERQRRGPASV